MRYSDLKHGQLLIGPGNCWISIRVPGKGHYLPCLSGESSDLHSVEVHEEIGGGQQVIIPTLHEIINIARSKCK